MNIALNKKNIILLAFMLLIAYLGFALTPSLSYVEQQEAEKFINAVPTQFADWHEVPSKLVQMDLVPKAEGERSTDDPYDDTLMRTYVNSKGETVQLALAYGKSQRQEVKIHRPELCYYAQGFEVKSLVANNFEIRSTNNTPIIGKNMLVENANYQEAVSYWIRIGELYSESPWQTRFYIIKKGLTGNVVDGALVRASGMVTGEQTPEKIYQLNKLFLHDLINSISNNKAKRLLIK